MTNPTYDEFIEAETWHFLWNESHPHHRFAFFNFLYRKFREVGWNAMLKVARNLYANELCFIIQKIRGAPSIFRRKRF